jgi:translocation and assembly module TamB
LAPADIAYFVPQVRLKHDIAGQVSVDGTLAALNGELEFASAGAKAVGKFRADVSADEPNYAITVQLAGLDLRRWLEDRNLAGVLSGTAEVSGDGFALAHTAAKGHIEIRSAEAQGWSLGQVTLDGRLQDRVAAFEGNLKSKLGGAGWSGKIALGERRPTYDLALSVENLDVERMVRTGEGLQGKLSFRAALKGTGFDFAGMNARVELKLLPSTLGPVKISQGELNAAVSGKKLHITRAALVTEESTLSATGELGLGAEIGGKLDYRLRTADVSPWLTLVQGHGSGAVDLTGVAQGNLADLKTEGGARLSGLKLAGIAVRNGNVKYSLQGSKSQFFPRGTVTVELAEVDAGLSFRRIDASAKLARQPSESMQFDISAQDAGDHRHALNGLVDFAAEGVTVRLKQAGLTLDDGLWKLAQPATLTQRGEGFLIDELALRNGKQGLSLRGRFGFSGQQDLKLNAEGIPLKAVSEFLPQQPKMTGLVGLSAQIGGTAAAPEIVAAVRLRDTTVAGQAYAGANADVNYKDKQVSLRLAVQQDATHALNGSGTLPIDLSWNNGVRAELAGDVNFRAQSTGISLGFLNAFSGKSVTNISGEVSLDLLMRGPVKQPDLRGQFRLRGGRARLVPLGVEMTEIALTGSLTSKVVTIGEFTAKAKDGEIHGSGSLALKDFEIGGFKVAINVQRWPAIETTRYQVRVAGNVEVQGTLSAPKVTGQLTVIDGSLRPDLAFLEQTKVPLKRDETIVIVNNGAGKRQPQQQGSRPNEQNDSEYFKRMSLDLKLRAPRNLWIRHPQLVSELSGDIQVRKTPNHDVNLIGRIETVRGWLAFQGRRFELSRGIIEFTGGDKINPSLDIRAEYRLPQYQVDANIGGTVEKPSLTLASTPRLEQADILALLIFGKPMTALNQKEQGSLQQSALGITSGYVAGKIANSVASALGLDSLGVDVSDIDSTGGQVGFGHYVGRSTYVSVSQQLSGEQGQEVSLEYQVAPDWKIGTSATSTGSNGIDVIWHKRY